MNTALICVIFEELDGRLPRTRTQLYRMITECLLKRHTSRQVRKARRIDDMTSVYRDGLIGLGKLAFDAIQKDRLYFDETEMLDLEDVVNLGFLSRETGRSKINPVCRFVFCHKTFQEYLAACYLVEQLKSDKLNFEEILLLENKHSQVDTLWQVIVFSAGMLGDDAQRYLEALVRHSRFHERDKRHRKLSIVLECLAENNNGAVIALKIASLFPQKLNLRGCLESDKKYIQLRGLSYIVGCSSATLLIPRDTSDDRSRVGTNPSLNVLDLSLNGLTDTDMKLLTSSLQQNTTIEGLILSFNFLGGNRLHSIAEVLALNCYLRRLDLSWNNVSFDGLVAVGDALHAEARLNELSLRGNLELCPSYGPFYKSSQVLNLKSVKRLDMSFVINVHVEVISKLIRNDSLCFLEYLNMSNMRLSSDRALCIADCLQTNTVLKELNLSNNPGLGEYGSNIFLKALQTNNTLEKLDLSNTGLTKRARDEIVSQCKRIKV